MTQVIEGIAAAHPLPCLSSSDMHAELSLLFFQSGSREATRRKEGGGGKLTFKIAANSSSAKYVWRYKRYSWQLTLLYRNNESRVVQAAT